MSIKIASVPGSDEKERKNAWLYNQQVGVSKPLWQRDQQEVARMCADADQSQLKKKKKNRAWNMSQLMSSFPWPPSPFWDLTPGNTRSRWPPRPRSPPASSRVTARSTNTCVGLRSATTWLFFAGGFPQELNTHPPQLQQFGHVPL